MKIEQKQIVQANTFKRIITFFQEKTELQNIDLMINAGFCRNCIAKWYQQEAEKIGVNIDTQKAKEEIYNMPYQKWKNLYQKNVDENKMQILKNIKKK